MIDVGPIWVLQTHFKRFPGRLWGVLAGHILRALWLVEDARLPLHTEMFAQLVEPLDYRAVSGEGTESDLVEWLCEAQDIQ